jgi:UDP-N-acetylglucosamine 2-epimerase (non-hydrolysing)
MTIRTLCVFGTRPEAIKMAPVVRALEQRREEFESLVCLTAQHREMVDQIMANFGLSADFDLNVMRDSQSPNDVASRILSDLPPLLRETRPQMMIVQGDTTTTMSAALAAFMEGVPVAHVEAGLRTGNLLQPFPEEMNRRVTSIVSALHFAPTAGARDALLHEHVPEQLIHVTGNTVIDALLHSVDETYAFSLPAIRALPERAPLILVTVHRRESFGAPMEGICRAIAGIADEFPDAYIALPVHKNPRVRDVVYAHLDGLANVILTEPLDYLDFVHLMKRAKLILTDSGGVQEEAPSLGKPVLVLRRVTERPEGVDAGTARIVGTDPEVIRDTVRLLLTDSSEYDRMAKARNPYGDGRAAARIVEVISSWARSRP